MNKYASNSSKGCFLKVDLEYPKELQELHNDYPLPPDKIETKTIRGMLSDYQFRITDLYNIPIANVKKLLPNFFDEEILKNLKFYLRLGLKLKKRQQIWKSIVQINEQCCLWKNNGKLRK